MKMITWILVFCFSLNVLANSQATQELGNILDNYEYALSVEWDQRNLIQQQKIDQDHIALVKSYMSQAKVSRDDLLILLDQQIQNPVSREVLKAQLKLSDEKESLPVLVDMMKNHRELFFSQGTSWNGDISIWGVGTVILVILIAVLAYKDAKEAREAIAPYMELEYDCGGWGTQYQCTTTGSWSGNTWTETQTCGDTRVCLWLVPKT